jgi:hypothetical protein
MKCCECKSCCEVTRRRWVRGEGFVDFKFTECWGVRHPFEIKDVNQECVAYPEKRAQKVVKE